jgi:hypothetical protein
MVLGEWVAEQALEWWKMEEEEEEEEEEVEV